MADSFEVGVCFYFGDVRLQVGVGVWIGVCEVDIIIIIQESVLKREGKIWFVLQGASWVPIFVVLYVLATSVPAEVLLFRLFFTVNYNPHPLFVQRVLLVLVQDVEFHFLPFESVGHIEEEPLWVTIGVYVILQKQVVLLVRYFRHQGQVAAFEPRLEHQSLVILGFGLIERFNLLLLLMVCRLLRKHLRDITSPDVPVFLCIINLSVRTVLVFLVYHVIESLPNPVVVTTFLLLLLLKHRT